MSVKCQNCGNVQPSGKFCPSCGGQMMEMPPTPAQQAAAAAMPTPPVQGGPTQYRPQQPPQPLPQQPGYPAQPGYPGQAYPTQPPKAGGGKGWVLWAAIGGGLVLVAGIAVAVLLMRDKPVTPPADPPSVVNTDPGKPTPPAQGSNTPANPPANPTTASGKSVGGHQLKLINQGDLGLFPQTMVVSGSYVGVADNQSAGFYKFDAKGKPSLLSEVTLKQDYGEILSVSVGDVYNNGTNTMLALYEQKLLVLTEKGGPPQEVDATGATGILVGDYDGDGKTETIFLTKAADGTHGFEVWKYPADSWAYKKEGKADEWPALFQTEMKAGKNNLLMGYAFEGADFFLDLYKWDGLNGPTLIGSFKAENKDTAPPEWIASGPTSLGPTLAVGRGGDKATVEILTVAADAKSHKSLGTFTPDGQGSVSVAVGQFTGQGSQILTVDETGKYFLYDIGK
ncbi:MAG TPA: zinc ribbon domain-containing protein [Symbiobacteriaceae bacterium]|nr:zinc ribbon domain-containing protein [Symbiobacteriaceae bacterium]